MLRKTWLKPLESMWHIYRVSVPSWPTLEYAQGQPVKALGGVLRGAFGLTQRRAGKASAGRYTVSDKPLEVRQEWIEKRAKREQISPYSKNHNVASVPSPQPAFKVLPGPNTDSVAYVAHLLETGQLEAFGAQKKATITRKIAEGDVEWLDTLARSRALGQALLGVAA